MSRIKPPRSLAEVDMVGIEAFAWPVSYRFEITAPWGQTAQVVTVDAPELVDKVEKSVALGRYLYAALVAPATSPQVRLVAQWTAVWRYYSLPVPRPIPEVRGTGLGIASDRAATPCAQMLTGHLDQYGQRLLYWPGAPRHWSRDGLLTEDGWEGLLAQARGIMMGASHPALGGGIELLIAYPYEMAWELGNPLGCGFRRVTHLRVLQHVDRAPVLGTEMWP